MSKKLMIVSFALLALVIGIYGFIFSPLFQQKQIQLSPEFSINDYGISLCSAEHKFTPEEGFQCTGTLENEDQLKTETGDVEIKGDPLNMIQISVGPLLPSVSLENKVLAIKYDSNFFESPIILLQDVYVDGIYEKEIYSESPRSPTNVLYVKLNQFGSSFFNLALVPGQQNSDFTIKSITVEDEPDNMYKLNPCDAANKDFCSICSNPVGTKARVNLGIDNNNDGIFDAEASDSCIATGTGGKISEASVEYTYAPEIPYDGQTFDNGCGFVFKNGDDKKLTVYSYINNENRNYIISILKKVGENWQTVWSGTGDSKNINYGNIISCVCGGNGLFYGGYNTGTFDITKAIRLSGAGDCSNPDSANVYFGEIPNENWGGDVFYTKLAPANDNLSNKLDVTFKINNKCVTPMPLNTWDSSTVFSDITSATEYSSCGECCNTPTTPVTYSCTGADPANAVMCTGDNTGLISSTPKIVVATCGNDKCEFTCNTGYSLSGSVCVPTTTPVVNPPASSGGGGGGGGSITPLYPTSTPTTPIISVQIPTTESKPVTDCFGRTVLVEASKSTNPSLPITNPLGKKVLDLANCFVAQECCSRQIMASLNIIAPLESQSIIDELRAEEKDNPAQAQELEKQAQELEFLIFQYSPDIQNDINSKNFIPAVIKTEEFIETHKLVESNARYAIADYYIAAALSYPIDEKEMNKEKYVYLGKSIWNGIDILPHFKIKFIEGAWRVVEWSADKKNWMNLGQIKVTEGDYKGKSLTEDDQNLIIFLNKKRGDLKEFKAEVKRLNKGILRKEGSETGVFEKEWPKPDWYSHQDIYFAAAIQEYEQIIEKDPEEYNDANLAIASLYAKTYDYKKAMEIYNKLLAESIKKANEAVISNPSNEQEIATKTNVEIISQIHNAKALLFMQQGNFVAAVQESKAAYVIPTYLEYVGETKEDWDTTQKINAEIHQIYDPINDIAKQTQLEIQKAIISNVDRALSSERDLSLYQLETKWGIEGYKGDIVNSVKEMFLHPESIPTYLPNIGDFLKRIFLQPGTIITNDGTLSVTYENLEYKLSSQQSGMMILQLMNAFGYTLQDVYESCPPELWKDYAVIPFQVNSKTLNLNPPICPLIKNLMKSSDQTKLGRFSLMLSSALDSPDIRFAIQNGKLTKEQLAISIKSNQEGEMKFLGFSANNFFGLSYKTDPNRPYVMQPYFRFDNGERYESGKKLEYNFWDYVRGGINAPNMLLFFGPFAQFGNIANWLNLAKVGITPETTVIGSVLSGGSKIIGLNELKQTYGSSKAILWLTKTREVPWWLGAGITDWSVTFVGSSQFFKSFVQGSTANMIVTSIAGPELGFAAEILAGNAGTLSKAAMGIKGITGQSEGVMRFAIGKNRQPLYEIFGVFENIETREQFLNNLARRSNCFENLGDGVFKLNGKTYAAVVKGKRLPSINIAGKKVKPVGISRVDRASLMRSYNLEDADESGLLRSLIGDFETPATPKEAENLVGKIKAKLAEQGMEDWLVIVYKNNQQSCGIDYIATFKRFRQGVRQFQHLESGQLVQVRLDEFTSEFFNFCRKKGVVCGIIGGDSYRSLRLKKPTNIERLSDFDITVPTDAELIAVNYPSLTAAEKTSEEIREFMRFADEDMRLTDRQIKFIYDLSQHLKEKFPEIRGRKLLDIVGEAGQLRPIISELPGGETAKRLALLSDGTISGTKDWLDDALNGIVRSAGELESKGNIMNIFRIVRVVAEEGQGSTSISSGTLIEMKILSNNIINRGGIELVPVNFINRVFLRAEREGNQALIDLLGATGSGRHISWSAAKRLMGTEWAASEFRASLENIYWTSKHLAKIFENSVDPQRAINLLDELGIGQFLREVGYDLDGLKQMKEYSLAGKFVTPEDFTEVLKLQASGLVRKIKGTPTSIQQLRELDSRLSEIPEELTRQLIPNIPSVETYNGARFFEKTLAWNSVTRVCDDLTIPISQLGNRELTPTVYKMAIARGINLREQSSKSILQILQEAN